MNMLIDFFRPRGDRWLHGGFLNLIHDLVDAKKLCWAEVAAATASFYLGRRTYRLGILSDVFASVGQIWVSGPLDAVDHPGDYEVPLLRKNIRVSEPAPVETLTVATLRREIAERRVIILDLIGTPGHCALVTGYVTSRQGHTAVEIADPGGGKSLVPLPALNIIGWQRFRLTRPAANRGTRIRRRINWSDIRRSIDENNFLSLNLPTEPIRKWGGVIPVIGDDDVAAVLGGAKPPDAKVRWIQPGGTLLHAVDQVSATQQVVQWSAGPWVDDAAAQVSTLVDAKETIVAWVDSEALRQRGWILQDSTGTKRRFRPFARSLAH